mmetsp:Transcript_33251/g.80381  ORF Transcript_33251/g.80381 Transcript_33251/m.80381 type:complete len:271 (+) Transcript_33251:2-814(+)
MMMMMMNNDNSVQEEDEDLMKDEFAMTTTDKTGFTPFHVIATSASLRPDLLQSLLDQQQHQQQEYPINVLLAQKDKRGKTMMDYLLFNRSKKAIPLIQMIFTRTVVATISKWGSCSSCSCLNRWKTDLVTRVESSSSSSGSSCWDADGRTRRMVLNDILQRLVSYTKLEATSVLELALWKMSITQQQQQQTSGGGQEEKQNDDDRSGCRVVSGANVVIPNVTSFLWEDDDGSDDEDEQAGTSSEYAEILPPEVSWLEGGEDSDDDSYSTW